MPTVELRDVTVDDAAAHVDLLCRNRADIEAVDPPRPPEFWTLEGQRRRLDNLVRRREEGSLRYFMVMVDGVPGGDVGITGIERGWFQSAHIGYLVDAPLRGRGVGTEALRLAVALAFGEMRLHRLDAGVLTTNVASQRVLAKGGFRRVGLVERYLYLAGSWRDNYLYEQVGPDSVPEAPA